MVNTEPAVNPSLGGPIPSLEVTLFERWEELEALRPEWNALLAASRSPSIFLTWEWLQSWWEAFGDRARLLVLAARSQGRLVAIAPFSVRTGMFGMRRARFLGDGTGDSDNLDFICGAGWESSIVEAAVSHLDAHRGLWDLLELNTIRAESPTVTAVESAAQQHGWRIHRVELPHLSIRLPRTWEEFLPRLSKKMQEAVPARRRILEKRYRAQVKRCASAEELPRFLAELFRLHALRWKSLKQAGAFTPARQYFYERMADRLLANGWLDFRLLELDGVPVAAQFGFCYGGVYSYLQSGFDPAYARYSPGWALGAMILRDKIADGGLEYDFLGGEDPYKLRWAPERRSYVYFTIVRPGSRGVLLKASDIAADRAIEAVRSITPRPIRRAARRLYRTIGNKAED